MESGKYEDAMVEFEKLNSYKDSRELYDQCQEIIKEEQDQIEANKAATVLMSNINGYLLSCDEEGLRQAIESIPQSYRDTHPIVESVLTQYESLNKQFIGEWYYYENGKKRNDDYITILPAYKDETVGFIVLNIGEKADTADVSKLLLFTESDSTTISCNFETVSGGTTTSIISLSDDGMGITYRYSSRDYNNEYLYVK